MVRFLASSLLASVALAGFAQPASALALAPLLAETRMAKPQAQCASTATSDETGGAAAVRVASAGGSSAQPNLASSKAVAILGGVSAFERIRLEQAASSAPMLVRAEQSAMASGSALAPGSAPPPCSRLAMPRVAPVLAVAPGAIQRLPRSDDFLQTRRLSVSHTAFDQQWSRVSRETLPGSVVTGDAMLRRFAAGRVGEEALAAVNAWTNRRVRYVEDARLYGKPDYWAGARSTLQRRAGDCEDIAVAKLQLLAAMGVARSDMYLTIARDLARHADHAVLVVKLGDRYWLLDNATDRVLDAGASYDYQPVLSFSEGRKWLHGAVLAAAN
jgi:predicted transglutaminase-like cysteine proteinase